MPDIKQVGNRLVSVGFERAREFLRGNKRTKVISIEEKRRRQRGLVTPLTPGVPIETIEDIRLRPGDAKNVPPTTLNFQPSPPPNKHNIFIVDLVTLEKLEIQNVPQELDYDPKANFATIATMARNNPFYHYTGSEDVLKLDLDWYSREASREDVIRNCRVLEALTKNDSFNAPPHPVKLIWGNELFSEAKWLVTAAPYRLSLPHRPTEFLHTQAYQFVTLKRITADNLSREQIRRITN